MKQNIILTRRVRMMAQPLITSTIRPTLSKTVDGPELNQLFQSSSIVVVERIFNHFDSKMALLADVSGFNCPPYIWYGKTCELVCVLLRITN